MKSSLILSSAALALMTAPALAGSASGCGTNCQLQAELDALRSQVDELSRKVDAGGADKQKFTQSGGTGIELKLSGQVNRGVLFSDDGDSTEEFFVDNDNSSTRFRITGSGNINPDVKMGVTMEVQMESNSTADVSQLDKTTGGGSFTERKLEWYIDSKTLGRLSVGQGDTASNGTSEVDLSGTGVVGYSGIVDLAGGLFFFDEAFNQLAVGDLNGDGVVDPGETPGDAIIIGDVFNQYDGLSRRDRVRYDTPEFAGFTASGSVADEGRWDVALRYAGEFGAIATEAAIAYTNDDDDDQVVNGSASILHKTSGLNLTVAAAEEQDSLEGSFYYIKGGWQTKALTPLGKTAFAIDYSMNEDTLIPGDESETYGIFAVQKIDRVGTEFYIGARNHQYDAPGRDFDDVFAVLTGARVKF